MMNSAPPPENLERFWHPPPASTSTLPAIRASLAALSPTAPPLRISRVAQLDASLLDGELENILHAPVKTALEGVRQPGRRDWEPEILALLRLAVMQLSLWETSGTYGTMLQNLRYRNEGKHAGGLQASASDSALTRFQKLAYTALIVLPPYLHTRLQDRMLSSSWADEPLPRAWLSLVDLRRVVLTRGRRREEEVIQWKREWKRTGWELLGVAEKLASLAGLVNFLIFLHNGKFRTLIDRVLQMRLVYSRRTFTPNVSFEYLNRQLVWEAFTEFLLFILPLINLHRFRLRIAKTISSRASKSNALRTLAFALPNPIANSLGLSSLCRAESSSKSSEVPETDKPSGPLALLPSTTCPICFSLSGTPTSSLPTAATSFADPTLPSASLLQGGGSFATAGGPSAAADTSVKIPYVADCRFGCRYCYYCLVGALARAEEEVEDHWECLRCGGAVRGARKEVVVIEGDDGGGGKEENDFAGDSDETAGDEGGYEVDPAL